MANPAFTAAEMAKALRDAKGFKTIAARRLGCSLDTVERYVKWYEECETACREAEDEILDLGEAKLIERVKAGEGWAVCFLLKTKGKRRGYVERMEVSGKDGNAVKVDAVITPAALERLSDAELEQLRDSLGAVVAGVRRGRTPEAGSSGGGFSA